MKILIIGYGKMGKTIEEIALERNHVVRYKVDQHTPDTFEDVDATQVDVAIEFTQPDAAPDNIRFCLKHGIPVVSGTTGWLSKKAEIEDYCNRQNGAFFYTSNYSIGVNIFFKLNQYLAKLMKAYPEYKPSMEETHHIHKKDAPSGTAISLAEAVVHTLPNIKEWVLTEQNVGNHSKNALPITAFRKDEIPGTHIVSYGSEIDEIKISHTAHTRKGFALGAVLVAEWLRNKKGVLDMDDFLQF